MGVIHQVKQGEHLSGIALKYGFANYKVIWTCAENAQLKQKRLNPNVLFPGDQVFIPDKKNKECTRSTDRRHTFIKLTTPLSLRFEIRKQYEKSLSNATCDIVTESDALTLTLGGQGRIERPISKTAHSGRLIIRDTIQSGRQVLPLTTLIEFRVGDLDPVDEVSGQAARLANLGYYLGSIHPIDADELSSAIEEFQCEHHLVVDGKCGPKTQVKLKQAHGC